MDDYDHPPLPEDDQETPLIAPAPANLLVVRRELKRFLQDHAHAQQDLEGMKNGAVLGQGSRAPEIVAAVACGVRYPADADDERYQYMLDKARNGDLRSHVDEGIDEITGLIAVVKKSLVGLEVLDALGTPLPGNWSNMPASLLSRAINRHCHLLFGNAMIR